MGSPEKPQQPLPIAFACEYALSALPQDCPCDESIILDQVLPDVASQRGANYMLDVALNGLDKMRQNEATIKVSASCDGPKKSLFLRRPIGCGLKITGQIRTDFSNENPTQ